MGLLRVAPRVWVYTAVITATLGIIAISIMGAYAVLKLWEVNKELCHATEDSRIIMRNILETSEELSLERSKSIQESIYIQTRTDELLALIPPIDCSKRGGPVELGS